MGIGDSKKVTNNENYISTTTQQETNTTIGDIGFTGANAVDLVNILGVNSLARDQIVADKFDMVVQKSNEGFTQLMGGAASLNALTASVAARTDETGKSISSVVSETANKASDLLKKGAFALISFLGIIFLFGLVRGKK